MGVVCIEGLGRYEHGLARDLGLAKLASALWGRWVEAEEADVLLEPYGEWAGLASVYLLAGLQPWFRTLARCRSGLISTLSTIPLRLSRELIAAQAGRGGSIVLTGGASVGDAYEHAARLEPDWSKVTLWWGDERCVPPDDERSNYRLAKETLLDRLEVPAAVHRIRGELEPRRLPPTTTTRCSTASSCTCCCSGSAVTATWRRSLRARRSSTSWTAA